jgi:hypothetical protein
MRITDKALKEFIQIYEVEFGEKIDETLATEIAHRVLAVYRLLRRKLPEGYTPIEQPMQRDGDHPSIGLQT